METGVPTSGVTPPTLPLNTLQPLHSVSGIATKVEENKDTKISTTKAEDDIKVSYSSYFLINQDCLHFLNQ